jgi:hypothetical protein
VPRMTALLMLRSVVTAGSRNTRLQAARYALPGLDLHQPIAPASWRFPQCRRRAAPLDVPRRVLSWPAPTDGVFWDRE